MTLRVRSRTDAATWLLMVLGLGGLLLTMLSILYWLVCVDGAIADWL